MSLEPGSRKSFRNTYFKSIPLMITGSEKPIERINQLRLNSSFCQVGDRGDLVSLADGACSSIRSSNERPSTETRGDIIGATVRLLPDLTRMQESPGSSTPPSFVEQGKGRSPSISPLLVLGMTLLWPDQVPEPIPW